MLSKNCKKRYDLIECWSANDESGNQRVIYCKMLDLAMIRYMFIIAYLGKKRRATHGNKVGVHLPMRGRVGIQPESGYPVPANSEYRCTFGTGSSPCINPVSDFGWTLMNHCNRDFFHTLTLFEEGWGVDKVETGLRQ